MKKMLSALVIGSLCAMPMMGETYQTKGYGVMQTNDIYTVTVGPGTVETRTVLNFSTNASDKVEDINAKATVNILKVDLSNQYVTPKVAFADKYKIQDVWKTIPQMMTENTSYQNHYFAGVNGDFFGFITCGVTVANGKYVYAGNFLNDDAPFEGNHFIIDKDGLPYIADHVEFGCGLGIRNGYAGDATLKGTVTYPDGTTNDQLIYNQTRGADQLVLYSTYIDRENTGANMWGNEASLTPIDPVIFGAEGEYKVTELTKNGTGGKMTIPTNGYVLSGHGASKFEDIIKRGDKIKMSIPFKADGVENSCRETVGGWPRLVTDGTPLSAVPSQTPSDLGGSSRRARTAVGFSEDRKTLYIVVVEEGSTKNQGLTFKALGSFMEAIGCYNAMNLDGGGSSVLHVENLGQRSVVQGLTTTYNRPVMNGLFLVTNAPEDREIASIEVVDKALNIKPGRGYVPTIYGYNKYGVLVCTDVTEFTLEASDVASRAGENAVSFNSGNRKMIAPESGEFTLTAKCGDATFEIPVTVSADGIDGLDPDTEATFAEQKTTPVPEKPADWPEETPESAIYLAGNINGWKPENPMIIAPVEGQKGLYEFDLENANAPIAFKFTTLDPRENGGWNAFKDEGVTWHINDILAPGKDVKLIPGNDQNITTPWAGKFHFLIDTEKATISVTTETPRPAITAPEHLYLIGNLDGHEWDTAYTGAELTGKDGVYTIENVTLKGEDAAYFAFTTTAATTWDEVNKSPRYGAWTNDCAMGPDGDDFYECQFSWKVAPGRYNFTVDFNTGKLTAEMNTVLVDITPVGYDWSQYEVGTEFKFTDLPETFGAAWSAPVGVYNQETYDNNGHVTTVHLRGLTSEGQDADMIADVKKAFTIQDLGGNIGNSLVFNQQWAPGHSVKNWPFSTLAGKAGSFPYGIQLTFYPDVDQIEMGDVIRVRLVMQLLYRARHDQSKPAPISSIYATAFNSGAIWEISHDGVGDTATGAKYPIKGSDFYRWENEGTSVATMPAEHVNAHMLGTPEPWDLDNTTNEYLINSDRFMVYEYDINVSHIGGLGIHVNIDSQAPWVSYIFREVRFFKVESGENAVSRAESNVIPNNVKGSLAGTRNISYRYYTEDGMKEIDTLGDRFSDVDNVIVDNDEDAPVEYYNLQGVRVQNPTNGLYIKRQGNKVSKVVVR